jgi:hypothetical protein
MAVKDGDGLGAILDIETEAATTLNSTSEINGGLFNDGEHYGGFSNDSNWFAFPAGSPAKLWLTKLTDQGVSTTQEVPSEGVVVRNKFTPDATHLVYFDYGKNGFQLAEMGANGANFVRELSVTDFTIAESEMWMASDSTAFAYLAASGEDYSTRDLYVADLLAEDGLGTRVTTLQNVPGRSINWVQFQP